jgi:hypothetical protein
MHWPLPRSPKPVHSPPIHYERHPHPTSQQSTNPSDSHMSNRHPLAPSISTTSPHLPSACSRPHLHRTTLRPRLPSHLRQPQKSKAGTKTPLSSVGIEIPTPIFGRYRCKHPAIPNLHCHSTQHIRPTAHVITRHQRKITYIRYHTFEPNTPTAHITCRPKPNLCSSTMPPAAAQCHQPGSQRLTTVTLPLGQASPPTSFANISQNQRPRSKAILSTTQESAIDQT